MKNKGYFLGNKTAKKNKLYLLVIIAVLVFIPAILAFINYSIESNKSTPLTDKAVKVSLYDGDALLFEETEDPERALPESLVYIFDSVIKNLTEASETPRNLYGEKMLLAVVAKSDTEASYKCFFSENSGSSYCVDGANKIYLISDDDALAFMSSSYSETLYDSSVPPKLYTTSNDVVLPLNAEWKYKNIAGEVCSSAMIDTTDDIETVYDMAGILGLEFENEPDECSVKVYKSGIITLDISHTALSTVKVDPGTTLRFVVSAVWNEDADAQFYGKVNYDFKVLLRDRSEFILDKTELELGDFVTVACTNILDINKINFHTEPDIEFSPVFFEDGDIVRAAIPFSQELKAGEYKLTFSYGATQEVITLNVSESSDTPPAVTVDEKNHSIFNASVNSLSTNALQRIMSELDASYSGYIFCRGAFGDYASDEASILYSYGTEFSTKNISYILDGTMYTYAQSGGVPVKALNAGAVLYSGSCDYLGKFVVIEHGLGIRTVYGHLGSINVSVGDIVKEGESIGRTGTLNSLTSEGVFVQCYVYNTLVDYTNIAGKALDFYYTPEAE
ncbi:MAG: M23 family metallopeptidase [Clostridia bacterium]|nr:M23 family metallopeptidase [Clostridia bacterium]